MRADRAIRVVLAGWLLMAAGCAFGPKMLEKTRLRYNRAVKCTSEEQLLLNIVRLRYTDTPSSLGVSNIAAQHELQQTLGVVPFFTSAASNFDIATAATVLPQVSFEGATRPTITYTPEDDQEFTRKLFTPMSLEGIVFLTKTVGTWPVSTVMRLWLETLNRVDNAQTASGPTPALPPTFAEFRTGIDALQTLQDRNQVVVFVKEIEEKVGGAAPAANVTPRHIIEAAKGGFEYRPDPDGKTWSLVKKKDQPELHLNPEALHSPEGQLFVETFHLKPGLKVYPLKSGKIDPFAVNFPAEGVETLDLEPRSLLQVLYYVSKGVEVPPEHVQNGVVMMTVDAAGVSFDWSQVTENLFTVHWAKGCKRPKCAHVAVCYMGYWFYIDETDQPTKSTFSLLMELSRLQLGSKSGGGPVVTLPLH
ncbi:hypothetical protein AYO40_05215 [Planctomycetaceae bacterium SCGC AG-212-D15]|nr:hypothetical protein AYO40_05215 [Planctomycetaceae bacterium SCGC AG-212-D15]